MRVLMVLVAAVLLAGSAAVVGEPREARADHGCTDGMPERVGSAMGNLFIGRYLGSRRPPGRGRHHHVFAVERVHATDGDRDEAGRMRLAAGQRSYSLRRVSCGVPLALEAGTRYLVSARYLSSLSTNSSVAWRLGPTGSIRLVREYDGRFMDPRLAEPRTVDQAVQLMLPAMDGVGRDGVVPTVASHRLTIPCEGEARLEPEDELPPAPDPMPVIRGSWSRMTGAPFGATDGVGVWMRDELLVVDPGTGRAGIWDAIGGTWRERRASPIRFDPDSLLVWAGRRLVLLAVRGVRLIPLGYHPATNEWWPLAEAPIGPATDAVWTGGTVVVASADGRLAAYDPYADCWRALPPIEGAGSVHGLVWTGDRLLADTRTVTSGAEGAEEATVVVELDPATLTWREGPPAPTSVGDDVTAIGVDGQVLYWAWDAAAAKRSNLRYDPATGVWETLDWACPASRRGTTPIAVGPLVVSSDGRVLLDPATGTCRAIRASGRRVLGRATLVATGGALIVWSGRRPDDGPPVRDGVILRLGPS